MDNLYRVEDAVSATSSGNLTWERWPIDQVIALGFAGQRNPLGFALVHYLGDPPSSAGVWNVVLVLTSALIKMGVAAEVAKDAAWQAFDYWRDSRCRACFGRGITSNTHQPCPSCSGSGQRPPPVSTDHVRDAISFLIEAEQWMEGQLNARLKRGG